MVKETEVRNESVTPALTELTLPGCRLGRGGIQRQKRGSVGDKEKRKRRELYEGDM